MSRSTLYRTIADTVRKHARVTLIATSSVAAVAVVVAGVLGAVGLAVGLAVGAAPWARAADNVAKTVQGSWPLPSGQPDTSLFEALTGMTAHDRPAPAGAQLDTIRSANHHAPDRQQASATAARHGTKQAAPGRMPAGRAVVGRATAGRMPVGSAPRRQAPEHQAVTHQAVTHQAVERQPSRPKVQAADANPYLIYDSITPGTLPSGAAAAVYANGAYATSLAHVAGHYSVLWIDTNGSDPSANVLDVEPGDATPAGAAQWVKQRLSSQPRSLAIVYTMRDDWQQVKRDVGALPRWMRSKVRYWIADPTGVPHIVVGASATQWYWGKNYDITTANRDFYR